MNLWIEWKQGKNGGYRLKITFPGSHFWQKSSQKSSFQAKIKSADREFGFLFKPPRYQCTFLPTSAATILSVIFNLLA